MTRPATDCFVHPVTGELIEATTDALKQAHRDGHEERSRIRLALAPIQAELALRAGPATLPARRYRTDMQAKVAECPRCGGHSLVDESAGAA